MIVTLSSSEQSSFISYFFHQRSTGDQHVYVQKHPNSAHASTTDFLEPSMQRKHDTRVIWMPVRPFTLPAFDFRNDGRIFGIKDEDRFLYVYIIRKTGSGPGSFPPWGVATSR